MGADASVNVWYGTADAHSLDILAQDLYNEDTDEGFPEMPVPGSLQELSFIYSNDSAYPFEPSGFGCLLFSRSYDWEPWTLEEMSQECEKELATCREEVDRFLLAHGITEQAKVYVHTSLLY